MAATILLLDDDEDLLASMAELLELVHGHHVIAVRSVAELEARAGEVLGCDVALLDIHLGPGAPSGLDAFEWLRRHRFRGRIVFMTGHARSHPLVSHVRGLGMADVVEKPITDRELRQVVEAGSV